MPLATRALTVADVHRFAAECFAPDDRGSWGLEIETFVRRPGDPAARPAPELLPRMPLPAGSRVTVEPGGQLELSSPPCPDPDTALDTVAADERELGARLADVGLTAVAGAVDPRPPRRVLELPRYRAMEAFFDAGGPWGRQMMCNTASVQVNLGTSGDPSLRWQVLHRIGPLLVALFAASPGVDPDGVRWASLRQRIWAGVDPGRTAAPRDTADPARVWAEYLLAADVMLIRTGAGAVGLAPGTPFGRWLTEGHPLGWPVPEDLRYHASTLFPPVRPRGWFELRVLDALPVPLREAAVVVVAAAVLPAVAAELLDRLPDTSGMWRDAARHGLAHPRLARAAQVLLEVTAAAADDVTARPERAAAVARLPEDRLRRDRRGAPGSATGGRSARDPGAHATTDPPAYSARPLAAPKTPG